MFRTVLSLLSLAVAAVRGLEEGDQASFLPWTYGKAVGGLLPPEEWASKYPECGGDRQSPILLSGQYTSKCETDSASWYFVSKGCTLRNAIAKARPSNWGEVAFEGCDNHLTAGDKTYKLLQIHLHSSAEHLMSGYDFAAEAHFVHVNVDDENDLKVIGIFLQLQAEIVFQDNVVLDPMLQVLSTANEDATYAIDLDAKYNPYALFPVDNKVMIYPGSLTTPPCAEIVTWVIFEQPVGISRSQLEMFRRGEASVTFPTANTYGNNNRPVQPLNGRKIEYCSIRF